jgi:pimeloyl-ACP methyl ester carboxylesterase
VAIARAPDGTEIFYCAIGKGVPLLLSAASFSTHRHWASQAEDLGRDLRVVTWDYRGHGRSGAPASLEQYTFERVVEDLDAVHEAACGYQPTVLGGLSIGGLVSLVYALRHPERVRAIVLVNTGPGFKNPEALARWELQLEKAATRLEEQGLVAYLEGRRARAEILGLDPDSKQARAAREGVLASSPEALARFARGVAAKVPGVIDELVKIRIPTLILIGEHDPFFHRAGEVLEAKLPRGRKILVEGAGHVVNLDRSERFAASVRTFLEEEGIL